MDSTVIVALPAVDEKVYKLSSEKVPHLTLVMMDSLTDEEAATVVQYVQHAASELSPFELSVDYRGELGPDNADVLFFKKNAWDIKRVAEFRHYLLLNDTIKLAHDSVPQFDGWTPHLTLGYPESPAHEDDSEHPGIHYVQFDRIAVWTGDYEGPDFRLQYADSAESDLVVAMSDLTGSELGEAAVRELFHYGVKGMRWGVRTKDRASQKAPTSVEVTQTKPGKFAKATGGANHPAHPDAINALAARQKAKASTTDALSNAELQQAVNRMQLEARYTQLQFQSDRRSRGARFAAGLLGMKRYNGKDLKFQDQDEVVGEQTRDAVKTALAFRAAKKAATTAAGV